MRLFVVVAVTAALAPFTGAADEKTALEGEWKMVEFVKDGESDNRLGTVVIKGDTMTIGDGKRQEVATFTLDPKAKPPAIDLNPVKGDVEKGRVVRGIYKLEKDKLTICFGLDASARPKEFKSDKNSKTGLFVLERLKK